MAFTFDPSLVAELKGLSASLKSIDASLKSIAESLKPEPEVIAVKPPQCTATEPVGVDMIAQWHCQRDAGHDGPHKFLKRPTILNEISE